MTETERLLSLCDEELLADHGIVKAAIDLNLNVFQNCDSCRNAKRSMSEEPCTSCIGTEISGPIERVAWKMRRECMKETKLGGRWFREFCRLNDLGEFTFCLDEPKHWIIAAYMAWKDKEYRE